MAPHGVISSAMTALAFNVSSRVLQAFFGSVSGLPRTYWFLWGGSLMNRIGSLVMPMMAVYLTTERHLTLAQTGTVISLFGFGSLLASQVGGVLADRVGRRATMLLSLCTSAFAMLSLGFAATAFGLMVSAFFLGLTADLYRPASQALLADIVPPADRVRAFGLLYWAFNLGFAAAAVAGGLLAKWSFRGLFIIDAASTLVMAGVVYRGIPETRPARPPRGSETRGSFLSPFFDLTFLPFLLVHLLMVLVFFQFQIAMPIDMKSKGLDSTDIGFAMAMNGVLIVAIQPWVTRRLTPWRRSRALALAALCIGLGFGANVFAANLPQFMLTVCIWTMGEVIMAPMTSSIVADMSPADMRGRYQGAFGLVWSLAMTLGPWVSGMIISWRDTNTLWALCLVGGLLAALGQLSLGPGRRARLLAMKVEGARD